MDEWSVDVQVLAPEAITDKEIEGTLEQLADHGVAVAYDQVDGRRVYIQLNVEAESPLDAWAKAADLIEGLPYGLEPQGGRILTAEELRRELDEPVIPELVGVAEIAEELHVSKARVNELQGLPGFPAPVARLKSGPVWTRPSLNRFRATWQRKPGRPRRASTA